MSFLKLILKNPFRSKSRASLVILAVAVGVACIVALGSITGGLSSGIDDLLHTGGADFIVSGQMDSSNNMKIGTEDINSSWLDKIKNVHGVNTVAGVYFGNVVDFKNSDFGGLIGLNPGDLETADINLSSGKVYKNNSNEIIIGKLLANDLNKSEGDSVKLDNKTFKITGVFETGDSNKDLSAFTSLSNAQNLDGGKNKLTMIFVKVNKGADVEKITDSIDSKYNDSVTTIKSVNDLESFKSIMDILSASSWAISLLAIVIGGIGVINSMLMTVYERTKEFGLLKAIGWSKKRILFMVLGESIVTTVVGAIVGSIIGVIGAELLIYSNILTGISPLFSIDIFVRGFVVAIVVGLIGGLYPAIRAVRLSPTEALGFD